MKKLVNWPKVNKMMKEDFFYWHPWHPGSKEKFKVSKLSQDQIYYVVEKIKEYRLKKGYKTADELRKKIEEIGYSERKDDWQNPIRNKILFAINGDNISVEGWIVPHSEIPGEWINIYHNTDHNCRIRYEISKKY